MRASLLIDFVSAIIGNHITTEDRSKKKKNCTKNVQGGKDVRQAPQCMLSKMIAVELKVLTKKPLVGKHCAF